jgi:hypothetical protein
MTKHPHLFFFFELRRFPFVSSSSVMLPPQSVQINSGSSRCLCAWVKE